MAKQTINIGSAANDGTGSTLREAFDITNDNFTELYGGTGGLFHKIEGANFTGSLLVGHSTTGTLSNAQNNTGIGIGTLDSLTSGDSNVAIGRTAGGALTSGSSNIAIGHNALITEDTGQRSVAIGEGALQLQNNDNNNYNIAIGHHAGQLITSGVQNTLMGGLAGDALTTGSENVAIGYFALSSEDGHGANVAVGHSALKVLNAGASGGNAALGYAAGIAVSTGKQNTLLGSEAGTSLTTGSNNIVIGYQAAASAVDVSNEVTIGDSNIANVRIPADSTLKIGASGDLQLEHLSSNSFIKNTAVGDLYIENQVDDKDVIFRSDDGSGGLATYFFLDGSAVNGSDILGATVFPDKSKIYMGTSGDFEIYHDATDTWLDNFTGNLNIRNQQNSGDIIFRSDNGNGGVAEYFRVDGGLTKVVVNKSFTFEDNIQAQFGSSADLRLYHNGTNSNIENFTGTLQIIQNLDDGDISFRSDDGSGGTTEYFRVDGGSTLIAFSKPTFYGDGVKALFGNSSDLNIYHNGTNSLIENSTGDFYISNKHDDGDIIFFCDDGSGGTTEYFRLDGGTVTNIFSQHTNFIDSKKALFGTGSDLEIYHNGTNSKIENTNGDLEISNYADDKDIIFKSDDGSGGVAEYFRLDGGDVKTIFSKDATFAGKVSVGGGDTSTAQMALKGQQSLLSFIRGTSGDAQFFMSSDSARLYFSHTDTQSSNLILTLNQDESATFAGDIVGDGDTVISTNTSDGSDNAYLSLTGGGANSDGRGARARYYGNEHASLAGVVDISTGNISGADMLLYSKDNIQLFTDSNERVRINASGYIYVNTGGAEPSASQVGVRITGAQGQAFWNSANSGTTGYNHFNFYNGNGVVGSIVTNGSATAFNTSSDYRLKEDLKDFDGLDKVSKIPVYDFKWKVDDSRSYGVLAHELEEVIPNAVSGEKDADEMQGVDYSKVVPVLIKAIQELEARVKTLENK